jgi:hypothetical protein
MIRRAGSPDGEHVLCELADGTIARIPLWMIDAAVCAAHSLGTPEPVAALKDLRQLLDDLDQPQGGDARSNALRPEAQHEQSLCSESSASAVGEGADEFITSDSHE